MSLKCQCGKNNQASCVCGIGSALIGPADMASDGTIQLYWEHEKPAMRFPEIVAEFGTPNVLDTSPGGFAQWRRNMLTGTPYTEVRVVDQDVIHCCPLGAHSDYVYTSVCMDLTPEVQMALYNVTKSVTYDRLTHKLTAACHVMGANLATILLAARMQLGQIPLSEAPGHYAPMIKQAINPTQYPVMNAELLRDLALIGCSPPESNCSKVKCSAPASGMKGY